MMNVEFLQKLKKRIKKDEAYRAYPYDDKTGHMLTKGSTVYGTVTFGYGLTYLTEEESDHILQMRLRWIIEELLPKLPEIGNCNHDRLIVIISMIYQLGFEGYKRFSRMREAIQMQDWERAAEECLDSKAYRRGMPGVRKRFEWYAKTLREGK